MLKWFGTPDTFTLDFGSWEPEPVTLATSDGVAISEMIAGYIDRLMKKMKDLGNVDNDDENTMGTEESITTIRVYIYRKVLLINHFTCREKRTTP